MVTVLARHRWAPLGCTGEACAAAGGWRGEVWGLLGCTEASARRRGLLRRPWLLAEPPAHSGGTKTPAPTWLPALPAASRAFKSSSSAGAAVVEQLMPASEVSMF